MRSSSSNNNNKPKYQSKALCIWLWDSNLLEFFSKPNWEVFTKKKHICPNRGKKSSGTTTTTDGITPPSTA